jgi:hypothetical protein
MKSKLIFFFCVFLSAELFAQSVSVNATGAAADASSIFDVSSTTKGMLIPRMTTTERIAIVSPATGLIVYDNTLNQFYYYNGSTWISITTGTPLNYWTLSGSSLYNNSGTNVGIGLTSPSAYLDITGTNASTNSLQLRSGNISTSFVSNQILFGYNNSTNYRHAIKTRHHSASPTGNAIDFYTWNHGTDAVGTIGTKFVATFDGNGRLGVGTSTPLNTLHVIGNGIIGASSNVVSGSNSLAVGELNKITNSRSLAYGYNNTVSGVNDIIGGYNNQITGNHSIISGISDTSSADATAVFGFGNYVSGYSGFATGQSNKVLANRAFAAGDNNIASGNSSAVFGGINTASGTNSFAGGLNSVVSGDYSITLGLNDTTTSFASANFGLSNHVTGNAGFSANYKNKSSGDAAATLGVDNVAASFGELAIGTYGTTYTVGNSQAYNSSDRAFNVGNGTSSSTRSDAFTILKNGNIGISNAVPTTKLDVNGNTKSTSVESSTYLVIDKNNANAGTLASNALTFGNSLAEGIASKRSTGGNQSGLDFYTNSTNRMSITNAGNIGIGTTAPTQAKLVVNGDATNTLNYGYLNSTGAIGVSSGAVQYSIYASQRIAATEFNAFSDARIKNVKGISKSNEDLETLQKIRITDYVHIDTIRKGNKQIKKVIAQELKNVYPQAVSTITDAIPDVYKKAVLTNGFIKLPTTLKIGDKVKIVFADGEDIFDVKDVNTNGFAINSNKSGDVFVFGQQVSDFHTVDYEALTTLNISATQELSKQLQELKEIVKAHQVQITKLAELLKAQK